jgi:hypothetical protein
MQSWINEYVNQLSSAEYHLQTGLLILFLCFILYKVYTTHQRFRFINDTATSKIASAAQGYVELKGLGELMPGPTITSPFSHRRCLWYQCIIEKRKNLGKKGVWVEESNEISDHLFFIKDDTDECVILPEGAHVIPSEELRWYGSGFHSKSQGKLRSSWFSRHIGFGRYRFTEKLITIADPIYAIGFFNTLKKISNAETLHKQANVLVEEWKKQPAKYLKDFDIDKNGKIQNKEWKIIRLHALQEVKKNYKQTVYHTLQKPQEKNQPFVISALQERELLKKKLELISMYLVLFLFLVYVLLTALQAY